MQLREGATNLAISYTALSLSVPERVRFRYQLEGVADERRPGNGGRRGRDGRGGNGGGNERTAEQHRKLLGVGWQERHARTLPPAAALQGGRRREVTVRSAKNQGIWTA